MDADDAAGGRVFTDELAVAPLRALLDTTPADDILVLSYTANLGFFSRAAAARARSRGARVTVISDPSQTTFDPELVRGAGVDWLTARAWCDGAFHPKLIVAASDRHATVCIGSGNATPAGWVTNAELWVRVDATPDAAPSTVADTARFLEALADSPARFGPGAADALQATAKRLDQYAPTLPGPQVVSSVTGPILNTLPSGPVDELVVCSPFLDEGCVALTAVCDRLDPMQLTVHIAESFRFDGARLEAVVAARGGTLKQLADGPDVHGKLLEWSVSGRRHALVGSPNVTRAGLCRTLGDPDANCELAIICDLGARSIAPATGAPIAAGALSGHRYLRPVEPTRPMIAGIVVGETGCEITLTRAASGDLEVEAYEATVWTRTGRTIPSGESTGRFIGWWPPAGAPLRVRPAAGGDPSTAYPATDPARLAPRRPAKRDLPGTGSGLVEEDTFLAGLRDALARVRVAWNATHQTPGIAGHVAQSGTQAAEIDAETNDGWASEANADMLAWMDSALGRLHTETGAAFSAFVLPELARRDGTWHPPRPEQRDDRDSPEDEQVGTTDAVDREDRRRERRIRDLRRWCERQLDPALMPEEVRGIRKTTEGQCTLADVCIATVVEAACALDAWEDAEIQQRTVLRALRPLTWPPTDIDLTEPAASAAAVGLWIATGLAEAVNPSTVPRLRARRAAEHLRPLITQHLDPEGLADRCATLATREHDAPDPLEVLDVVLRAVTPDPFGDLQSHFRDDDPVITGTVLRLGRTLSGDGVAHLVRAGALADAAAPVAVVASTANWGTVVCAWAPPTLVICAERPVRRGFRYHLPGGLVQAAGSDNHRPPTSTERAAWYRTDPIPPEALEILNACGVTENGNAL